MAAKKVSLLEFSGNPNIGLFIFTNDKFAICGREIPEKQKSAIEDVLGVPVYMVPFLGTDLAGVFCVGNNDVLVVPNLFEHELRKLQPICEKHGVALHQIKHTLNTFGNSMCFGKDHFFIDKEYDLKFKNQIKKILGTKMVSFNNPEYKTIGAMMLFRNGKYFVSQELKEKDIKDIAVDVAGIGTMNSGSPFVTSGVVCNSNGILLGSSSSTIEVQNILEALNYL